MDMNFRNILERDNKSELYEDLEVVAVAGNDLP